MNDTSPSRNYWTTDRIMRLIIGLAVTAGVVWLIGRLSNVLLPFVVACFIAYILQPLVRLNMRLTRMKSRGIPSILTLLEVTALLVLLAALFVPMVESQIEKFGEILHRAGGGRSELPPYLTELSGYFDRYYDPAQLRQYLSQVHIESLLHKGTSLLGQGLDILMRVLEWLIMIVYVLFILIDYPQIVRGFKLIFPAKYRDPGMVVVREVRSYMDHYFRGQGFVALCACIFYCIGFTLAGLPLAIPMGVLVGILYMIPYFQYVTLIPVFFICLLCTLGGEASLLPMLGKCALVYVVSQSICDYIITPHVMGKELGMNPAVILLSLSVWGALLGIIGMIIALPVSALIMTYYERYISTPKEKRVSLKELASAKKA